MRKILGYIMLAAMSSVAFATPYASQIRVNSTSVAAGATLTINYMLNEPTTTVSIDIIKASDSSVVATIAGTGNRGANSVNWTVAGAAGSYRVKITATNPTGSWAEVSGNKSPGGTATTYQAFFSGLSPKSMVFPSNTDSDDFGLLWVITSYLNATAGSTNSHSGAVILKSDISVADGTDGFASRTLKHPADPAIQNSTVLWGSCFDPDSESKIWVAGQDTGTTTPGGLLRSSTLRDTNLVIADPAPIQFSNARWVAVRKQGTQKFAYACSGNSVIDRAEINATGNLVAGSKVTLTSLATTTRYSKQVLFDAAGNLYYVTRANTATGTAGGVLYRWSAATVASATAGSLTETNAEWAVTSTATGTGMLGAAITPNGNVYVVLRNEGIYLAGNTSTAANVKTLAAGDLQTAIAVAPSTSSSGLAADSVGNLYLFDSTSESVRIYSNGGSKAIVAPTSQTFAITGSAVRDWSAY